MASKKKVAPKKATKPTAKKAAAKPVAKAVAKPAKLTKIHEDDVVDHLMYMKGDSCCSTEKSSCCSGADCCCADTACGRPCFCPLLALLTKPVFWAASFVNFVVFFGFDMWWHGTLLMPDYLATAHLWRSMAEMQANFGACIAYHAGMAMAISAAVLLMNRTSCWGRVVTGVVAAAPVAICNLASYMHLPLESAYLPQMWAAGLLIQGVLAGIVVKSLTSGRGSCCCK